MAEPLTALLIRDHDGGWATLYIDGFHRDGDHTLPAELVGAYLVEHRVQTFKRLGLEGRLGRYPAVLAPWRVEGVLGDVSFDLPEAFEETVWDALLAAAEEGI